MPRNWRKTILVHVRLHICQCSQDVQIFVRMIFDRIEHILDASQPEEQHGFQKKRHIEEPFGDGKSLIEQDSGRERFVSDCEHRFFPRRLIELIRLHSSSADKRQGVPQRLASKSMCRIAINTAPKIAPWHLATEVCRQTPDMEIMATQCLVQRTIHYNSAGQH